MLLVLSCGYRPAYGGPAPEQRLSVHLAGSVIAEPELAQEVLSGARTELARADADQDGTGFPMLMVEILRVDENPRGIAAIPEAGEKRPRARVTAVGLVGRAWVVENLNGPQIRDTGDVRRVEVYNSSQTVNGEMLAYDGALRAAARALGRALVQRVLGEPAPTMEPM